LILDINIFYHLYQDSKKTYGLEPLLVYLNMKMESLSEIKPVNALKQSGLEFLILSIMEDKNGAIWIGTEHGIIKYEATSILYLTKKIISLISAFYLLLKIRKKSYGLEAEEGVYFTMILKPSLKFLKKTDYRQIQ
jgi:hypothetical protein